MKRYLLSLWLICGFLGALIPGGNRLERTEQPSLSAIRTNALSASWLHLPHTELEVYTHSTLGAMGQAFRNLTDPGYLPFADFRLPAQSAFIAENVPAEKSFSCKEYLSHIYPSHNFW